MPFRFHSSALLFLLVLLLQFTSCKKGAPEITENLLEQYFELNILNNDFIVLLATDSSVNITDQYAGYRFRLLKTTLHNGDMTATKDGTTYTGSWSSNDDYGNLIIQLNHPTDPTFFSFLNRQWRFVRKAIPIMELAPWGTTDPKVLHMERQ